MLKVSFSDAYKRWRNQARKYSPGSIIIHAINILHQPANSNVELIKNAPWQLMLMVKWVCQDELMNSKSKDISDREFYDLRQMLWEFPEKVDLGPRETLPGNLFKRQLLRPQIGFQRPYSPSFARESALLVSQPSNNQLKVLFQHKTGLEIEDFLDISLIIYGSILQGKKVLDREWLGSLQGFYTTDTLNRYICSVSRSIPELITFCRNLPNAKIKVASEYFEFPILTRYPFLRLKHEILCWHPVVYYRGMEEIVHATLSEAGHEYMKRFSKLFEQHVIEVAKEVDACFLSEQELKKRLPSGAKVPDGLLVFPECNVFIEAKSGIFDESVMTIGHSTIFAGRTKALINAVAQAWSASNLLRQQGNLIQSVLKADEDYLLIVTNKELSAGRGNQLATMYPSGTLNYPSVMAAKHLPLENIYILSIEDFERLMIGAANNELHLPAFLSKCVKADQRPDTAVHFFEQHLDFHKIPRTFSKLVQDALSQSASRIEKVFAI